MKFSTNFTKIVYENKLYTKPGKSKLNIEIHNNYCK